MPGHSRRLRCVHGPAIQVSVAGLPTMEATVAELAEEEGADSYVLGCSCASNAPGGGAIAHADVSGVSLAPPLAMAHP